MSRHLFEHKARALEPFFLDKHLKVFYLALNRFSPLRHQLDRSAQGFLADAPERCQCPLRTSCLRLFAGDLKRLCSLRRV